MSLSPQTWWEKASRDELFHRQSERLRFFISRRVAPFCAHYRELMQSEGLEPRDLASTEDLPRLPFTSKRDLKDPKAFILIPDEAQLKRMPSTWWRLLRGGKAGLEREFRPIFSTSTTGRSAEPVPFFYTAHDLEQLTLSGIRLMQLARSQADFRHLNAFPFAPHLAFWQAHYAGTGFNTFMLSTGGGKVMGSDGNVRLMNKIQADALIGMPTFLYHLLQQATEQGAAWPKLKRLILGGEKVPRGMRRKLRSLCAALGAEEVKIASTYGFTEAKMAWSECLHPEHDASTGFHIYPDMAFIEVIDPETGERVPDGSPGEIVFTPLDARGSVVLRYRTGDLIEGGLTHEACPACGRRCPRLLGRISRVSDIKHLNIAKLKGTLVDFAALEHVLDEAEGLGTWQIELRKRHDDPLETDEIHVHAVALESGTEAALEERICRQLLRATEISPNAVHFHTWEQMRDLQGVGTALKEEKVVDHRPASTPSPRAS